MSKNCQLQHLTLLCAAMEDSFNLLDYEWSNLEDDVSPSRRVRYSLVKNGESSGIELSSSLEIDMDSLGYQPLLSSSPTAVTSTSDTITPAAVSFTSETATSARPVSPIIWTTPIPTTTTTVPVPAPTGNPTAVPLWRASLQAMSTGGAEMKTSPRSAAAALAPPPVTEPSAPLPAPVMSPGPASAAAVQGEVICSALGCMVMGTTEALGTHWLDLHVVEKMLWLCPMPRCHMKSRSSGMLDIHLRVRHKASRPVARRLREEIPPLVDWVVNRKYQFPGVARPQFVILPALLHGALAFNMKETVITEVAAIFPKGNTQGPSSVPRAPAAETLVSTQDAKQPQQVTSVGSWYELAVRPTTTTTVGKHTTTTLAASSSPAAACNSNTDTSGNSIRATSAATTSIFITAATATPRIFIIAAAYAAVHTATITSPSFNSARKPTGCANKDPFSTR